MRAVRFKYRGKFISFPSKTEGVRFLLKKTDWKGNRIAKKVRATPALVSQQKAKINQ